MINFGSVPLGSVLPIQFTTYGKTNGESITLTGLAVTDIEVYKGTSVTQRASDAGYALLDTDGIDVDGVTGFHGFSIDTGDNTDAGFYAAGSFYTVLVSAVTVDSQTVNFIAATFRLVAQESVAGVVEVDVTHFGGTAGTFNAGRPEVNTSHAAGTAWNSGAIQAATFAADAITAAKVAADVGTEIATAVWAAASRTLTAFDASFKTGYELAAAGVQAIWDALTANLTTVGSIGKRLADNVDAAISTRLATAGYTAPDNAGIAAIKAQTDQLVFTNANKVDAAILATSDFAAAVREAIADALIGRNIGGGANGGRTVEHALAFLRNKWEISAGTLTVYDTDDTTVLWTAALGTTAAADPVTSSDPA